MEINVDELTEKIRSLNVAQTGDAVRNLRLSLQFKWEKSVDNDEAKAAFRDIEQDEATAELLDAIKTEHEDPENMQRWGQALLLFFAAYPDLNVYVDEAVDDALATTVKDFGLTSLIVVGIVLVLLKYRPSNIDVDKKKVKIKWKENDVNIISDLAKAFLPFTNHKKDGESK
jgi:hypothetical protein